MKLIELLSSLTQDIRSTAQDTGTIQAIRADAYRYYSLQMPAQPTREDSRTNDTLPDGSGFVSADVLDAVEHIKSVTCDAFGRARQPVFYGPDTGPDIAQAQEWAEHVFYDINQGEELIRHSAHEAALAKVGPIRISLEIDKTQEPFTLQQLTPQQAQSIANRQDVLQSEASMEAIQIQPGVFVQSVTVQGIREISTPRIEIDPINPEDFFIIGSGLDDGEWDLVGHTESVLQDDLIAEGYDEDVVERLPDYDENRQRAVDRARKSYDNERAQDDPATSGSSSSRRYRRVTHVFARVSIDDQPPIVVFVKYGLGCSKALEMREVDGHDYECWKAYDVPGKFYGLSAFELSKGVQDSQTTLKREILNNIWLANRYRTEVDTTAIDPDERDNVEAALETINSTIFVRRAGAVTQILPAPLPKETPMALEMLSRDQESRTGISRTAQGVNGDVLAEQNARDMVEHYVSLGERRVGMMVRQNAKDAMRGIFRRIYDLTRKNAEMFDGTVIEIEGRDQPIMPSKWRENPDLEIATALTSAERREKISALLAWDERLTAQKQTDPVAGFMYQDQNKAALYAKVAELMDLPVWQVMTQPGSQEWMQAEQQAKQSEQQAQQQQMIAQQKQAEIADAQVNNLNANAMKTTADTMKTTSDMGLAGDKQELEEQKFEWGQIVNIRELELEDEQERPVSISGGAA